MSPIGIIGGSGFYKLVGIEGPQKVHIDTPFGEVIATRGYLSNKEVIFIPRHGEDHTIPPHKINYHANAYAMYKLQVEKVIATSAVGSMRKDLKPGDFVLPDQIIDFTKSRRYTFFDGDFAIQLKSGELRAGVYHVDATEPYCRELRKIIYQVGKEMGLKIHFGGTYVCTEGPRFETPAEIKFFRKIGGDIVGMTNSPEVFLFKELNICYALICVVTNYAAGMQKKVSHEEVLEIFKRRSEVLADLIRRVVAKL
ncbi:MAG: S-methyl-5'-thioadenosine phosphorylase [Candidatus Korarchaeota archaeon]|nr:S-methyl-5'-thioadenosine phosphorylase [Thermoproteota archaeon]MCR8455427.1 S-methyl-5'-thioadenosine phosphorylase [Thermoproteota archaeon]MCR8462928.1 S-methyl-5'-thioadenosine phosphorylase [Thermoproteota archaeon]MCR8470903.1 S-methyl-5'-thioadenosine phosphorylase [Thermoproteota archaeon]MCR8472284.1 S-methyl-5'-thioadenosine phosphorylase [Thermoproteota archaeon]